MHVRPARRPELAAIGELTVAAYSEWLQGERDPYADRLRNTEARYGQADLLVAVDEDDHTLLGTVTLCPAGSAWREIAIADEGELRMLATAPQARGRGIGAALTDFCLDRLREVGAPAVVLSTLPQMAGAQRLYARLGFDRTPERDWRPYPDTLLITYRKELGP